MFQCECRETGAVVPGAVVAGAVVAIGAGKELAVARPAGVTGVGQITDVSELKKLVRNRFLSLSLACTYFFFLDNHYLLILLCFLKFSYFPSSKFTAPRHLLREAPPWVQHQTSATKSRGIVENVWLLPTDSKV